MAWRDLLEPASFRGVQFHVDSNDMSGGRRTVTHEYPGRDRAFVEDMGRATRAITFDAYVLGANYVTAKNALLDALEAEGAGELVHPLYGIRTVQAGLYSVRESKTEGGMARFSLEFTETGEALYPTSTSNAQEAVSRSADSAIGSAVSEFLDRFSVDGLPQWAVNKSSGLLQTAAAVLQSSMAPLKASAEQLAEMNQDILRLQDDASELVRKPSELAELIRVIMGSVAESDAPPASGVTALLSFYDGFESDPESTTTPTRQQVEENRQALDGYLHQTALVETVRIAPEQEFPSINDAESQRNNLGDKLDEQAEVAGDDLYSSLSTLRSDMVQAIPDADARLPEIVTTVLPQTTPSIVSAYRLYADATRDQEIVDRNGVRHPGFVPGGIPIEVLTNG